MTTAEKVLAAVGELNDVTELVTNEKDNALEIGEFLTEGAEAGMALFGLKRELLREDYAEAGVVLGFGLAATALANKLVFEDGSRLVFTFAAVDAPPVEEPPE